MTHQKIKTPGGGVSINGSHYGRVEVSVIHSSLSIFILKFVVKILNNELIRFRGEAS